MLDREPAENERAGKGEPDITDIGDSFVRVLRKAKPDRVFHGRGDHRRQRGGHPKLA